ncbi:N-acetylmannosamine-6-phosphate 2-epimerase [Corynebacterium kroppenstedtii]|uniref:N-acetylmannosamine-6-phosphate 2-epimerase n=1 Tax=Corynebacterium sp. PCR 32 TaxID=3351342 RepID=UPI0030A1F112
MPFSFSTSTITEQHNELRSIISGEVIVSAQAPNGHPLRDTPTLTRIAKACVDAGTPAIRCGGYGGLDDITSIAHAIDVPIFGLTKEGDTGVYITPTVASVTAVAHAGAAIVCADVTGRQRPDGSTTHDLVEAAHASGALFMADCDTAANGIEAYTAGADIVSSTLAGYTPATEHLDGPDLDFISTVRNEVGEEPLLIAEGRYHSPDAVKDALHRGANAVIIGSAITDPRWITGFYLSEIRR